MIYSSIEQIFLSKQSSLSSNIIDVKMIYHVVMELMVKKQLDFILIQKIVKVVFLFL
jgi:hypothetical protein